MVQSIKVNIRSLKYPPRIEFGSLQLLSKPFNYGNQIAMFCSITKGERVLIPDYGLPKLIHQPDKTPEEIEIIFRSALSKYFPQIQFRRIECTDKLGVLGFKTVEIEYFVADYLGVIEVEL